MQDSRETGIDHVLVVNDNAFDTKMLRSLLRSLNIDGIIEARSGEQAIKRLLARIPDIMIVDWELPDLVASRILKLVRNSKNTAIRNLPVIIMMAVPNREDVVEANEAGASTILIKPLSRQSLLKRLESVKQTTSIIQNPISPSISRKKFDKAANTPTKIRFVPKETILPEPDQDIHYL